MIGTDRSDLDAMVEGMGREYEILKVQTVSRVPGDSEHH